MSRNNVNFGDKKKKKKRWFLQKHKSDQDRRNRC